MGEINGLHDGKVLVIVDEMTRTGDTTEWQVQCCQLCKRHIGESRRVWLERDDGVRVYFCQGCFAMPTVGDDGLFVKTTKDSPRTKMSFGRGR